MDLRLRDGYCYLQIFDYANRLYGSPPFDLEEISRLFGAYPLVSNVLRYLMNVIDSNIMLPAIVVTLSGVLHVDTSNTMLLSLMISHYLFSKSMIGGSRYPHCQLDDDLTDAIALAEKDRQLAQLARNTSLPLSEIQNRLTNRQIMTTDIDKLAAQFVRNEKKPLVVLHQVLDQTDRIRLIEAFPEFQLAFPGDQRTPHAMAAACRKLTLVLLLHKLNYNRDAVGFDVIDVGANWADHALAGNYNVHCCSPTIDYRDSCRYTERVLRLMQSSMNASIRNSYLNTNNLPNQLRCNNLAENCFVKAPKAISIHSLYDISESQLTKIFDSHGIMIMYACIHFHASILTCDNGVLANGAYFNKRDEIIDGVTVKKIDFSFIGESTHAYSHKYQDYITWIYKTIFISAQGTVILKEIVDDMRPGIVIIKFTRASVNPMTSVLDIRQRIWGYTSKDTVFVKTYRLNKHWFTATSVNTEKTITMKYVAVSAKFYNQLRNYCNRSATNEFNISSVNSAASSYNNRITINGNDIYTDFSVSSEDLMLVATSVYMACYIEKYNTGQLVKLMTDQQKAKRDSNSMSFFSVFKYLVSNILPSTVSQDQRLCSEFRFPILSDLIAKLRSNMHDHAARSEFDHSLEKIGLATDTREMLTIVAADLNLITADLVSSLDAVVERNIKKKNDTAKEIAAVLPPVLREHFGELSIPSSAVSVSSHASIRSTSSAKSKRNRANVNISALSDYLKSTKVNKFSATTGLLIKDMRKTDYICPYERAQPVEIPGDGKCCYRSLLAALKIDIDPELFKRLLSHTLTTPDELALKPLLTIDSTQDPETWGNTDVMMLVSRVFSVKICFHCGTSTSMALSTCPVDSAQCLHIFFSASHFSSLVNSEVTLDLSVKRLLEVTALVGKGVSKAKDRYNAYSEISSLDFDFNRSAYKLLEILTTFRFDLTSVLDVGGAPGGFLRLLNTMGVSGTSVSLASGPAYYRDVSNWNLVIQDFADFTTNESYSTVCCDLFANESFDSYDISVVTRCQDLTQLGGSMFVKLPIYDVSKLPDLCFEKVELFKPKYSPPASCEVYLVALNKQASNKISQRLPPVDYSNVLRAVENYIRAICDVNYDNRLPLTAIKTEVQLLLLQLYKLYPVPKKTGGGNSVSRVVEGLTTAVEVDDAVEAFDSPSKDEPAVSDAPTLSGEIVIDESVALPSASAVDAVTTTAIGTSTDSASSNSSDDLDMDSQTSDNTQELPNIVIVNATTVVLFKEYFITLIDLLVKRKLVDFMMRNIYLRKLLFACKSIENAKPEESFYFEMVRLNKYMRQRGGKNGTYKFEYLCDFYEKKKNTLASMMKACINTTLHASQLRRLAADMRLILKPVVEEQSRVYSTEIKKQSAISKFVRKIFSPNEIVQRNDLTETVRAYGLYGTVEHTVGGITDKRSVTVTRSVHENHTRTVARCPIVSRRDVGIMCTMSADDDSQLTTSAVMVSLRKGAIVRDVAVNTVLTEIKKLKKEVTSSETQCDNVEDTAAEEDLGLSLLGNDITMDYDSMPDILVKLIEENKKTVPSLAQLLHYTVFGEKQWLLMFTTEKSTMLTKRYFKSFDEMRSGAIWFHNCVYFLIYKKKLLLVYDGDVESSAQAIYSVISLVLSHLDVTINIAIDEPILAYHNALVKIMDLGVKVSPMYSDATYDTAKLVLQHSLATVAKRQEVESRSTDEAVKTFPKVDENIVSYIRAPAYIPGDTRDKAFRNAAIEFIHLNSMLDEAYDTEYKAIFTEFLTGRSLSAVNYNSIVEMGHALYNTALNKIVYGSKFKSFDYGHDGKGFVKYDTEKASFDTDADWVLITKNTEKMLNKPTLTASMKIDVMETLPPNIEFINGAPGCGKTTMILESVNLALRHSTPPIDLLLTTTRAGSLEIRERLKGKVDDQVLKRDICTITSYIINGKKTDYDVLYIDEVLITHAGAVALAISKARPRKVVMLGDKNQIPYIDRDRYFPQLYSDVFRFCDVTVERNVTHRCPIDVTAVLRDIYPGLTTTSKVERSLEFKLNVNVIPYEKNVLYMTWTQDDKQQLIDKRYNVNGSSVLTIHEAQGQTFDNVIMVRRQVKALKLFTSVNHAIVAFSRHRKTLVYYSAAKDVLSDFIDRATKLEDVQMALVRFGGVEKTHGGWVAPDIIPALVYEENVHSNHDYLVPLAVQRHANLEPTVIAPAVSRDDHYTTNTIKTSAPKLAMLQDVYDAAFPGCSFEHSDYQDIIESSDLTLHVDRVTINPVCAELYVKPKKHTPLVPVLKTMQPALRDATQRESLIAFIKRNGNAPLLCSDKPPKELGRLIFENFVKSAIDPEKYADFLAYENDIVSVNENSIEKWLRTQPPRTDKSLSVEEPIETRKYNEFSFMIKRNVKPPLEASAINSYAALQTIAYNSKDCNMVFCPVINVIRDRLVSLLRKNIVLNTGMSNSEMDEHISNIMSGLSMEALKRIENDFAKYDKSQLEMVYWFEYYLYKALGMDPYLLDIYMNCNRRSKYFDSKHGLAAWIEYQRRSGGSTTWLGNTLFALAILLCVYSIEEIVLLLAGGDDTLILTIKDMLDRSGIMTDLFNVEAKMLHFYYPYFCSKFLIESEGRFFLVPDPMKFITKLGRKDMRNYQHLEEYRISCEDNYSVYANESIYDQLSSAVCERYKLTYQSLDNIFRTIYSLVSSTEEFAKLFVLPDGVTNDKASLYQLEKKWTASILKKNLDDTFNLYLGSFSPVDDALTISMNGPALPPCASMGTIPKGCFVVYCPPASGKTFFYNLLDDSAKQFVVDTDYVSTFPDKCVILTSRFDILKDAKRSFALMPTRAVYEKRLRDRSFSHKGAYKDAMIYLQNLRCEIHFSDKFLSEILILL